MRSDRSLEDIMRQRFPRRELTPAARGVTEALLGGGRVLLVSPDRHERELPWRLAAEAGLRPLLVIAHSEADLQHRAEALAEELDLVACALHARLDDNHLHSLAEQLAAGKWDAALVSGRSLADPRLMAAAHALAPRLLVVEDAQRASMHGHRYDLAWLHAAGLVPQAGTVLALADVADLTTREELTARLGLDGCRVALGALDRPDLRIEARRVRSQSEMARNVLGLLADSPERAVIHVRERVEAERFAALVRDERGFDALDLTNLNRQEFGAALRRFREGGLRVIVTTGALEAGPDWPPIPISAIVGLPESLEMLHRQMHLASGDGALAVLLHERDETQRLERAAMRSAFDTGHLLGLYEALASGEELRFSALAARTGLHPEEVNLGVEALIQAGAVSVRARGDAWLQAEPRGHLSSEALAGWSLEADAIRRVRLGHITQVEGFATGRRCLREALAEALDYPLAPGKCECGRCRPREAVVIDARGPGGYPIAAGEFRGWALGLYRRPGEETPGGVPGKLIEQLKYLDSEPSGRRLAGLMAKRVTQSRTYRDCEVIVPVPPSDPDATESAAVTLARQIGAMAGLPMANPLTSASERMPQKELTSLSAKQSNIAQAFAIGSPDEVAGLQVLLVDDIFDSGATMQEAAKTLLRAGAADVRLLAAVRTSFGWRRDV